MSIAAFIAPPTNQWDLAIELGVALAEYCLSRGEGLYLLADPIVALEVGVNLIGALNEGSHEAKGDRLSSLVLLPFRKGVSYAEHNALAGPTRSDFGGEITELFDIGVFLRPDEAGVATSTRPEDALEQIIVQHRPRKLVALGNDAECWQAFQDGMKQASHYPSIITVEHLGDGPATENTTRLRPTGPSPSFPWMPEVKPTGLDSLLNEAWRHGALVSALFEELGKDA